MKRVILILLALSLFLGLNAGKSYAVVFSPVPADIYDLEHKYAYSWGIRWAPPAGEYITSASLLIKDIYNWTPETTDRLHVRLLNDTLEGVNTYWDGKHPSDYFSGQGVHLFTYTDPDDNASAEDIVYNFTAADISALTAYSANGDFGFGFDPDCHYYNGGVEFTVEVIPEPATLSLLGLGLLGLLGRKRRKAGCRSY